MADGFADRLLAAIEAKGTPAVVALDPVWEQLPAELARRGRGTVRVALEERLGAIGQFSRTVIDLIAPIVPAVKINSAYFECYHAAGVALYDELISHARSCGLVTIGDCKRGDVGHTAEMYARACLGGTGGDDLSGGDLGGDTSASLPDAVTISGYFGVDGAQPFIDAARAGGRGLFVLVRTSNPSAAALQDAVLQDGGKVHERVAEQLASWAGQPGLIGAGGYSAVGAVVATRHASDATRLRAAMPRSIFLVPGYGAQGGRAEDFAPCFDAAGRGAIIAAGRSVIFAYRAAAGGTAERGDWQSAIEESCRSFACDVAGLMRRGSGATPAAQRPGPGAATA
jgi:orotidine-5'-phosphate decarboxylase